MNIIPGHGYGLPKAFGGKLVDDTMYSYFGFCWAPCVLCQCAQLVAGIIIHLKPAVALCYYAEMHLSLFNIKLGVLSY